MGLAQDILAYAATLGNDPWVIAALVFATTFLVEDAAALAAAFLIAEGLLPMPIGYGAVALGIYAGDLWLYSMGYGARRLSWLRQRIGAERLERARAFLDKRLFVAVLMARILPTVRLPTYLGLGYTAVSFKRFALIAAPAVAAWTWVLFGAADLLAQIIDGLMGPARWIAFAAIIATVALLPVLWRRLPSGGTGVALAGPLRVIAATLLPAGQGRFGGPGPSRTARRNARGLPAERFAHAGGTLNLLRSGDPDGAPVLLIHGTPGSALGWSNWLADPPKGFHLVAVDRPGFGRSLPAQPLPELEDQAAALSPLLARLGRDGWGKGPPIILGHSLGGPIAALLAARNPGWSAGLVIAGGALDPDLERLHWLQRPFAHPALRWMLPRALDSANRELIALEAGLRRLEPRLSSIATPTVIVHGDADDLVPFANVDFLRSRLVNVTQLSIITLAGRDHFLPWKDRPALEHALRRLLDSATNGDRMQCL